MNAENEVLDTRSMSSHEPASSEAAIPIIVDLGSKSKKSIKKLKEGRGKLIAEVSDTVQRVRTSMGDESRDILPVVIVYSKKSSKSGGRRSMIPFMPPPFNMFR